MCLHLHHHGLWFSTPKSSERTCKLKHTCFTNIISLLRRVINPRSTIPPEIFHDVPGIYFSNKIGSENPRIFTFAELFIGSNGFQHILGSGGFGRVYRGTLPSDNTLVAVKRLAQRGERFEKTFTDELLAVAQLRHRNLVPLKGWCIHEDQEILLVYDYMAKGSLDKILFARNEPVLDWDRRKKIAEGLASALTYLHEHLETQIVHRDVKSSNVMLDKAYNARLGDFGLARWLHPCEIQEFQMENGRFRLGNTTLNGGTIGYLPPESFKKVRSSCTVKSDVFSFGIVVLEIVSGRRAVDLSFPDDRIVLLDSIRRLSDERRLVETCDGRLRVGTFQMKEMERLVHLALLCTINEVTSRPDMKWVTEYLSGDSELPALPSFKHHPDYISLSDSSRSSNSSNTTITIAGSATTETSSSSSVNFSSVCETVAEIRNQDEKEKMNIPDLETPREIAYCEIVSATNNFATRSAEADFGTAYYGTLDHRRVVVKKLGMKTCPALRARFADELRNLGRLRHRNLVQLCGWCTDQGEMMVIYDYSSKAGRNQIASPLSNFLFLRNPNPEGSKFVLEWHHRYNIIKSLASAILYLHEEWDEQVIHRNITSSAVILEAGIPNPRLGSFALAEFLSRKESTQNRARGSIRGIFGYMSPDYIDSGESSTAGDVYSFGVVALEVVSGEMAVDFRRSKEDAILVRRVRGAGRSPEQWADRRLCGKYDKREVVRAVKLGVACTESMAERRPSMRKVLSVLDGNDDDWFRNSGRRWERMEEWKQRNAASLSMIRRMQALGIQ